MKIARDGKISKHNYGHSSTINSLPKDLLLDIFSRAASESFTDLYKLKITCKDFLDVAQDNYIYQTVSLDKFPLVPWHKKEYLFLKHCKEKGNSEGLYRGGMLEYFKEFVEDSGLESLKKASEQGHKEAKYAYGMILLCSEDEEMRKQGLEQLRLLKIAKCVKRCGKNVRRFLEICWGKINRVAVPNGMSLCQSKMTCNGRSKRVRRGWPSLNDEDDEEGCEGCMWDHELTLFCNIFDQSFGRHRIIVCFKI
ncbi:hypothetical protein L6164_013615 [Bauhinia variegata]|nr:hypothetical protein L6164_013615 [Bauhinia variegata]